MKKYKIELLGFILSITLVFSITPAHAYTTAQCASTHNGNVVPSQFYYACCVDQSAWGPDPRWVGAGWTTTFDPLETCHSISQYYATTSNKCTENTILNGPFISVLDSCSSNLKHRQGITVLYFN